MSRKKLKEHAFWVRFGREKRMFFELFADTGAKKRGPELAGSLINTSVRGKTLGLRVIQKKRKKLTCNPPAPLPSPPPRLTFPLKVARRLLLVRRPLCTRRPPTLGLRVTNSRLKSNTEEEEEACLQPSSASAPPVDLTFPPKVARRPHLTRLCPQPSTLNPEAGEGSKHSLF